MELFLTCLLFLVGIALIVKGGDLFVDAAGAIARAFHIPTFIIGATIVSLATTLPEMIVSVLASLQGKADMAVGNAVGSVTANTALILAIAMLAMTVYCARKQFLGQILLLVAAATVLLVSCRGGALSPVGTGVLLGIFLLFMTLNIRSAKSNMEEAQDGTKPDRRQLLRHVLFFLLGAAGIVVGSQLLVDNGSQLALWLGVPERIIAVTLIAIGTSLPELVTTVTAVVKKEGALSAGNIIGANIIDLTLILPACSLASGRPLPVSGQSVRVDLPACLLVTLIAMVPLLFRQKTSRVQGLALLAAYAAYLVLVL